MHLVVLTSVYVKFGGKIEGVRHWGRQREWRVDLIKHIIFMHKTLKQ